MLSQHKIIMDFKTLFKNFESDISDKMLYIYPLLIGKIVDVLLLNRNSSAGGIAISIRVIICYI